MPSWPQDAQRTTLTSESHGCAILLDGSTRVHISHWCPKAQDGSCGGTVAVEAVAHEEDRVRERVAAVLGVGAHDAQAVGATLQSRVHPEGCVSL